MIAVGPSGPGDAEAALCRDTRFLRAVQHFNCGDWYAAHDDFEELWHESAGLLRTLLQGLLQVAVGQLHHERGNRRGATILTGEGLGRLDQAPGQVVGLDLEALRREVRLWLQALQQESDPCALPPPSLHWVDSSMGTG